MIEGMNESANRAIRDQNKDLPAFDWGVKRRNFRVAEALFDPGHSWVVPRVVAVEESYVDDNPYDPEVADLPVHKGPS